VHDNDTDFVEDYFEIKSGKSVFSYSIHAQADYSSCCFNFPFPSPLLLIEMFKLGVILSPLFVSRINRNQLEQQ
jgi:hypothetical protein